MKKWLLVVVVAGLVGGGVSVFVFFQMRQIEQKPDVIGRRGTARNYDEDLQKIRKLDLSLLKWSESLPAIETGMNLPVALAVLDDGNICIGGDKAVAILSPDGKEVKRVEMKLSPQALAVADKTIYVAGRKSVAVLTADGTQQAQWKPLGDKAHLVSLAASDEYVYAADAGNRVVMRYDRKTGKRTYKNGRLDSGAFLSGFNVPSPHLDVAVTPDGHLLTVDPGRFLVQVRDAYGNVLKSWGSAGAEITRFYGCCNPAAIAPLGKEGIVTYKKTLQRVKVYSLEGQLLNVAAGPNEFTDHPRHKSVVPDIAVYRNNRILVLDPIRKAVRVFKRKRF